MNSMNGFDLSNDWSWLWPMVLAAVGCMVISLLVASFLVNSNSEVEIFKKEAIQNECAQSVRVVEKMTKIVNRTEILFI